MASPSDDSTEVVGHPGGTVDLVPHSSVVDPARGRESVDMTSRTLARWTALAEDGGIGHAVSIRDHLAAEEGQLMFFAGEPIVVLAVMEDGAGVEGHEDETTSAVGEAGREREGRNYLGFCEGVVGLFHPRDVRFVGPLRSNSSFRRMEEYKAEKGENPRRGHGMDPLGYDPESPDRTNRTRTPTDSTFRAEEASNHLDHQTAPSYRSVSQHANRSHISRDHPPLPLTLPSSHSQSFTPPRPTSSTLTSPSIPRSGKGRAIVPVDQMYTIFSDQAEGGYAMTPSPGMSELEGERNGRESFPFGLDGMSPARRGTGQGMMAGSPFRIGTESLGGVIENRGETGLMRVGHLASEMESPTMPRPFTGSDASSPTGSSSNSIIESPVRIVSLDRATASTGNKANTNRRSSPSSVNASPTPNRITSTTVPSLAVHDSDSFNARASQRATNPFELDIPESEFEIEREASGLRESYAARMFGELALRDAGAGRADTVDMMQDGEEIAAERQGGVTGHVPGTAFTSSLDLLAYDRPMTSATDGSPFPQEEASEHLSEAPLDRAYLSRQASSMIVSDGSRGSVLSSNSDGQSQGSEWGGLGWMMAPKSGADENPAPLIGADARSETTGSSLHDPDDTPRIGGPQDTSTVDNPQDPGGYDDSDEGEFDMVEADAFPSPTANDSSFGSPMEIGTGSPPMLQGEAGSITSPPPKQEVVVRSSPMANSWNARKEGAVNDANIAGRRQSDNTCPAQPVRGLFGPVSPVQALSEESSAPTLVSQGESPHTSAYGIGSADSKHTLWTPEARYPAKPPVKVFTGSVSMDLSDLPSPVMDPQSVKPSMMFAAASGPRIAAAISPPVARWPPAKSSPGGTSVSLSAMARQRSGTTLVGATSMELSSSRNPVPITFMLGDHHSLRPYASPDLPDGEFPVPSAQPVAGPPRSRPIPAVAQGLLTRALSPVENEEPKSPQNMLGPFPARAMLGERRRSRSFSQYELDHRVATQQAKGMTWGPQANAAGLEDRYKGFMAGVGRENAQAGRSSPVAVMAQPDAVDNKNRARSRSLHRPGTASSSKGPGKKPSLPQLRVDTANLAILPPIPSLSPFLPGAVLKGDSAAPSSASGRSLSSQTTGSSESLDRRRKKSILTKDGIPSRPSLSKGPLSAISNKDFADVSLDGADFSFSVEPAEGSGVVGGELPGFPDEWGFVGSSSPVPGIFALSATAARDTPKTEQALLAIIQRPYSPSTRKKMIKVISEKCLPPSLRTKCYAWLQSPGTTQTPLRHDVVQVAEQLAGDTSSDMHQSQPALWAKFHSHRSFTSGMQDIQHLLAVYAFRHPKQARGGVDLAWIAALFLMNSFDVNEAYRLFEAYAEEQYAESSPAADRAAIDDLLRTMDGLLSRHLFAKGVRTECFFRTWSQTVFAASLPYPTALRTLDLVVATGPTHLIKTALAVLTLLSKRILGLGTEQEILHYLLNLPADALLSPDSVSKAAQKVPDEVVRKARQRVMSPGR